MCDCIKDELVLIILVNKIYNQYLSEKQSEFHWLKLSKQIKETVLLRKYH